MASYLDSAGLATLWRKIKAEDAVLAAADLKFAFGSYTATGVNGESNPNSLTFDFAPQYVYIYAMDTGDTVYQPMYHGEGDEATGGICMAALTTSYKDFGANGYQKFKKDSTGKTLYWYSNETSRVQFNWSNYEYYYFAIG